MTEDGQHLPTAKGSPGDGLGVPASQTVPFQGNLIQWPDDPSWQCSPLTRYCCPRRRMQLIEADTGQLGARRPA